MERGAKAAISSGPLEPLEVLVRVGAEVEVELGDPLLDDAPHRLAEVGHESHQGQRRRFLDGSLAEVAAQKLVVLLFGELVVDGEIRQVEEDVAHARVLPVHDPQAFAVEDEVRVEQVVVTRDGRLWSARTLDPALSALLGDLSHEARVELLEDDASSSEDTEPHQEELASRVAGWLTAHYFYQLRPALPEQLRHRLSAAYTLLLNKYWVDEIYDKMFVQSSNTGGRALDAVDTGVLDGAVVGVGRLTEMGAEGSTWIEKYVIYGGLNIIGYSNHLGARILRRLQSGLVHHYATILVAGFVILVNLILLFLWLGSGS